MFGASNNLGFQQFPEPVCIASSAVSPDFLEVSLTLLMSDSMLSVVEHQARLWEQRWYKIWPLKSMQPQKRRLTIKLRQRQK